MYLQNLFQLLLQKIFQRIEKKNQPKNFSQEIFLITYTVIPVEKQIFPWNFSKKNLEISPEVYQLLYKTFLSIEKSSMDSFKKSTWNSILEGLHGFLLKVLLEHLPCFDNSSRFSLRGPSRNLFLKKNSHEFLQKFPHSFFPKSVREVFQEIMHGFRNTFSDVFIKWKVQNTFKIPLRISLENIPQFLQSSLRKFFHRIFSKFLWRFLHNLWICSRISFRNLQ